MRTAISPEADVDEQPASIDGGLKPCGFGPPCDVEDLGGRTCESIGLGPGELACDPNTCKLSLLGCGPAPDQNSGATDTGGQGDTTGLFGAVAGNGAVPGLFGGDAGAFPFFGGVPTTPPPMTDEDGGTGGAPGGFPFPGGVFFGGGNGNGGFFGGGFFGGGNNGTGGNGGR